MTNIPFTSLSPFPAQTGAKRRYHAMVKPTGSICNLDCTYCYYLHKQELLGSESKFRISDEILETHIRQYIEGQDGTEVVFSWQGGEPTLLGLEFFEKVIELEKKYKRPNQTIENDLQTNGTLLNEDWAKFLHEHKFLVGLASMGRRSCTISSGLRRMASRPSKKSSRRVNCSIGTTSHSIL